MNVSSTSVLNLDTLFPFKLDGFQKKAIAAWDNNQSIVVCAPTGSGKTVIAEYAIHRALVRGKRLFYTTPLKALSNQKFRDFCGFFGENQVGLITGDILINVGAPILVMTTEIFRNMLYGTPIGQVGTTVEGVEAVVLDECHYLSDRQRGTVWEESIIYCPPQIQLLALSATIGNPGELTDWIDQVHGSTVLINSNYRPVPLKFYFSSNKGLFPLLNKKQTEINPRLKPFAKGKRSHRRPRREDCPTISLIVEQLQQREMLPAIYLIFNRRGCDQATINLAEDRDFELVNPQEAAELSKLVDEFLAQNPYEAARANQVEPLKKGIAAHHAGILPAWKELVERLFEMGLVKVVFATSTLAAGINMPARTVVISSLSKRSDDGHRLLTPSEFLQVAGRAGRRGMDVVGHVAIAQTPFEGAKEGAYLATAEPEPLRSWFAPSYGMVLNLLQTHALEEVEKLLEGSFAEYLARKKRDPQLQEIAELTTQLTKLDIELASLDLAQIASYKKLKERLREERRLAKTLQQQAESVRGEEIKSELEQVKLGTILYLKGKHVKVSTPIPAVLVCQVPGRGKLIYLVCLGANNRWYVISSVDVVGIDKTVLPQSELKKLAPPDDLPSQLGGSKKGDPETAKIAKNLPENLSAIWEAPEVKAQILRIESVEAELANHPLNELGAKPGSLVKRSDRAQELREKIHQLQVKYRQQKSRGSYYWEEFLNLAKVLQEFEALAEFTPTILGKAAAAIRSDNELWLGLAFKSGALDQLKPAELAAAVCALISETPKPDSWTNYRCSPEVISALDKLRQQRRKLIQVQHRYDVAIPVWLEDDLVGLVENWAIADGHLDWNELCENTSLDDGDLVRMFRRTVDVLWQIPQIPGVSENLQRNARQAVAQIEHFPI
ncbi:MAG: DEAD/DEAH box helicase [Oscillatoria sp. PMC 1068.18]|nr:DEAD/DEAH box helicase [Oscillatoria sp. PMC 1076.18]MEC4991091.1 DEAD/DEAH box helicase [Oscillatoria sp. PMC 1068.18]